MTICPLPYRAIVEITGPDCRNFLQGLTSNDVVAVAPQHAIYGAILTAQGKFLFDLFILQPTEDPSLLWLDIERERLGEFLNCLQKYKLRAKVAWQEKNFHIAVTLSQDYDKAVYLYRDPRHQNLGKRLVLNAVAMGDAAPYHLLRYSLAMPDGGQDMIVGKDTLIETNFDAHHGISWTKGCYIGQELTARMHYRALVKKRLVPISAAMALPAKGNLIYAHDREVGDIRAVLDSQGMALLALDAIGQPLRAAGVELKAANPA